MPPSRKTFLLPNVGFATRVADENLGSEARKLENFLVHDDTGCDVGRLKGTGQRVSCGPAARIAARYVIASKS